MLNFLNLAVLYQRLYNKVNKLFAVFMYNICVKIRVQIFGHRFDNIIK